MLNNDCLMYISDYITDYLTFKYFIEIFNLDNDTRYINFRLHKLKFFTKQFQDDIFYLAKFLQSINSSIDSLNTIEDIVCQKKYNIIYINSLSLIRYIVNKNSHYISSHCIINNTKQYHMYIYKFKNSNKSVNYYDIYIYSIL